MDRAYQDNSTTAYTDIMQASNAAMMVRLGNLVSVVQDDIPAPTRLSLIAALRERHTTMPAGREISHSMQTCLERALIQSRLHLMRTPGAAEGFRLAASQYAAEFEARREAVQRHLDALPLDAVSALGAIEWCERLATKFTAQEIARPNLVGYAKQLEAVCNRLTRFDPDVAPVLDCMIALLGLGEAVSIKAIDRLRQSLPGFAQGLPDIELNQRHRLYARAY